MYKYIFSTLTALFVATAAMAGIYHHDCNWNAGGATHKHHACKSGEDYGTYCEELAEGTGPNENISYEWLTSAEFGRADASVTNNVNGTASCWAQGSGGAAASASVFTVYCSATNSITNQQYTWAASTQGACTCTGSCGAGATGGCG